MDLTFLNTCPLAKFLPPVFPIRDPVLFWPLDPRSGIRNKHPGSYFRELSISFFAVFRNRDLLVRIRIRGSVPLTNGSGPESCFFRPSVTFKTPTKSFFSSFLLLHFEGTFTSFIKDKKTLPDLVPLGQKVPDLSRSGSHHVTGRLLTIALIFFLLQKSGASWPRRCLWPAGGREHDRSVRQRAFISTLIKTAWSN
jgi:hypothetical protein